MKKKEEAPKTYSAIVWGGREALEASKQMKEQGISKLSLPGTTLQGINHGLFLARRKLGIQIMSCESRISELHKQIKPLKAQLEDAEKHLEWLHTWEDEIKEGLNLSMILCDHECLTIEHMEAGEPKKHSEADR